MSPRLRTAVAALVALFALAAGFYLGSSKTGPPEPQAETSLQSAVFRDLQGQTRHVGDWPQKLRILNFWATWCAPCVQEMPLLDQFQKEYADKNLQVLGIALDNAANVGDFAKRLQISIPLLIGDAQTLVLLKELGNSAGGLPFSVYLDRQGRIVGTHLGPLDRPKLLGALEKMELGRTE